MRKLLVIVLLLASASLYAETTKNPDKFVSIGVSLSGMGADQTSKQATYYEQTGTLSAGSFMVDLRVPVSNYVTLFGGIGTYASKTVMNENYYFDKYEGSAEGTQFVVGARFYFAK